MMRMDVRHSVVSWTAMAARAGASTTSIPILNTDVVATCYRMCVFVMRLVGQLCDMTRRIATAFASDV